MLQLQEECENAAVFAKDCLNLVENIMAHSYDTFEMERLANEEVQGKIDLEVFVK